MKRLIDVTLGITSLCVWSAVLIGVAMADPLVLFAFGDSLTAGYGLPAKDAFPVKLQLALRARGLDVEVINAGVSGDTTADGLARLDWSLPPRVDAAIVEFGANDAFRGIPPETMRSNLAAIVQRMTARDIPVLLSGMLAPRNLGAEYVSAFDASFGEIADQYNCLLYPFYLDGVALDPKLNQPDMIHPNAAGVDVIVARILPTVEKLIARARANRSGHGNHPVE